MSLVSVSFITSDEFKIFSNSNLNIDFPFANTIDSASVTAGA
ncbi:hypothetical protein bcere0023_35660 [Bacillus cereus Rock4-2]|nr:hypothetical protein bcere0023_35660 [Bacillus cereus Rock4-2]